MKPSNSAVLTNYLFMECRALLRPRETDILMGNSPFVENLAPHAFKKPVISMPPGYAEE